MILPLAQDRGGIGVLIYAPFGRPDSGTRWRDAMVPMWAHDFDAHTWAQFFLKFVVAHPGGGRRRTPCHQPAHQHDPDNLGGGRGRLPRCCHPPADGGIRGRAAPGQLDGGGSARAVRGVWAERRPSGTLPEGLRAFRGGPAPARRMQMRRALARHPFEGVVMGGRDCRRRRLWGFRNGGQRRVAAGDNGERWGSGDGPGPGRGRAFGRWEDPRNDGLLG